MSNLNSIWREYLETVKGDIQTVLAQQGRRATGNAIDSMRIVQNGKLNPQLRGARYIQNLQTGRGSQPKGISRKFIQNIKTWMLHKGIEGSAFAIAKHLVQQGTAIKRGQPGVNIRQIMRDNMPDALKASSKDLLLEFKGKLKIRKRGN